MEDLISKEEEERDVNVRSGYKRNQIPLQRRTPKVSCLKISIFNFQFYNNAIKYWTDIPANDQGMLGGYQSISPIDIHR